MFRNEGLGTENFTHYYILESYISIKRYLYYWYVKKKDNFMANLASTF